MHTSTKDAVDRFLTSPAQAILLTGKQGSGTGFVATYVAQALLGAKTLQSQPYFLEIPDDGAIITIETIRELQRFLKLKVAGAKAGIQRIVLIHKAGRMGAEAQNALLKTLEEPPAGTLLILTAHESEELLPTIVSRVQTVQILPVGKQEAKVYFEQSGIKGAEFEKQYALSGGNAGLLYRLLSGDGGPLTDAVALAKDILAEPIGKRLVRVDTLAKDKDQLASLLDGLHRICHAALQASARKNQNQAVNQWQQRQSHVLTAMSALKRNANTKLVLDALFLAI